MVISTVRLFEDFLVLMNVWKILNKFIGKIVNSFCGAVEDLSFSVFKRILFLFFFF